MVEQSAGRSDRRAAMPGIELPAPGPEAVAEALRELAEVSGLYVDAVALASALDRARARDDEWSHAMVSAGRAIGLDVTVQETAPPGADGRAGKGVGLVWVGDRWRHETDPDAQSAPPGARAVRASPRTPLQPLAGEAGHGSGAHGDGGHGPSLASRMRAFARVERDDVAVVAVYAVAIGVLSLVTPVAVQALVSTVAFGALLQPVAVLTVLVFGALALAAVLRALQFRVVEALQERLFVRVATDLAHRIPRLRPEGLDGEHGPSLVNHFFEVVTAQKAAAGLLLDGLAVSLQIVVGLVVLGFYHPALLAFDAALVAGLGIALIPLGRRGPETSIKESKAKYAVAAWLQEVARKRAFFATDAGSVLAASRADALVRAYLAARRAHFGVLFRQVASLLGLQALAAAALLGVGGWLVVQRQLTLGQLVAAELIVTGVVSGLLKLGKQLESLYDLGAAVDKLGHLVDLPIDGDGVPLEAGRDARGAAVQVFGASGASPVLAVEPGGRALCCLHEEGARRALADALGADREDGAFRVQIDGVSARSGARAALRSRTAVLGPEPQVFAGTLEDNARAGRGGARDEDVYGALERAGLGEKIRSLPLGGRTTLGVDGWPLGRNELQRLMIARALVAGPALVVVDGALDGFDEGERRAALRVLREGRWTLVVLAAPDGVAARSWATDEGAGGQ